MKENSRGRLDVGVVNNKIYAIGGESSEGIAVQILNAVEEGTLSGTLPEWNNPPTATAGLDKTATAAVLQVMDSKGALNRDSLVVTVNP